MEPFHHHTEQIIRFWILLEEQKQKHLLERREKILELRETEPPQGEL